MSENNINQVELAHKIAKEAHEGQIRKFGDDKGKPYIVHPERVANSLEDPVLKAAAYLHDVCEDTKVTFDELLVAGINKRIISILESVTKKEGENYKDFINRIATCEYRIDAMKLKIADIKDNLSTCPEGQMKDKYRLALMILEDRLDSYRNNHFNMSNEETDAFYKWMEKHNKECRLKGFEGAIGGRLTFEFTPTGLGTATVIKCACGEEVNVTDYSDW